MPDVVPSAGTHNPGLDIFDIDCRDFARRRKLHNVQRDPNAAW
jgi:hypothetical protein